MNWNIDHHTAQTAARYPLSIQADLPAAQFGGRHFNPVSWNHRVIEPSMWPDGPFMSSPQQIIGQFQEGHYLQALAMVVSWGTMWRQPEAIWGHRQLTDINAVLAQCAQSIQNTQSIQNAWTILTGNQAGQLGWSAVITSKALHFLCRSLGFQNDPPVAIDNAVILKKVWPSFLQPIPIGQCPQKWRGNSFDTYCRYMTAIITWANQRHWTTTQMEATIFDKYY